MHTKDKTLVFRQYINSRLRIMSLLKGSVMRKHKIAIATLLLLIAVYLVQTLVIPPETAALSKYHLTAASAQLIRFTFVLPLITVWCIALFGYIRFSNYASSIKDTPDGKALESLSRGLLALALWLPASSIIQNTSSSLWHRYTSITEGVVIITNLIHVGMLVTVSYLVWRGSRHLLTASNISPKTIKRTYLYITTAAFAALIGYLVLFSPTRFTQPKNAANAYYLPAWLLLVCIAVPYIVVWYGGLEAVQNIHTYKTRVKGIVYKSALNYIAYGIAFSVISALTLRTLSTFAGLLDDLALKFLLLIIYALVFFIGIGYSIVWLGAKKLQLIEKV